MLTRTTILLFTIMILSLPAHAQFPITTGLLGEHGGNGSLGYPGNVGTGGAGGIPSGVASERNGGNTVSATGV